MPAIRSTLTLLLATLLSAAAPLPARAGETACTGDCDGSGGVSAAELALGVTIALGGAAPSTCAHLETGSDERIGVDDLVAAVRHSLDDCGSAAPTATSTQVATSTSVPTPTPTAPATATVTLVATSTASATPSGTATATPTRSDGVIGIPEAVRRDANGVAVHLGEMVRIEGVLTVAAGIYANNKLKVVAQGDGAGIMIFHQSSADTEAYDVGQRLRATGVVGQLDPTSPDNPALGTVLVDVTQGSVSLVDAGNPLPEPQPITFAALHQNGVALTGTLVRVAGVHRVSPKWPAVGDRSTVVELDDESGDSVTIVRFQRNTITPALVQKLNAIGEGTFTLVGIAIQDDATDDGKLLSGFQVWPRGADDIIIPE